MDVLVGCGACCEPWVGGWDGVGLFGGVFGGLVLVCVFLSLVGVMVVA
jgi:hypothetical protein